jgi:hypothetical protein
MRSILALVAVAGGLAFASTGSAHACNARGEFCGQPHWAANAFSGPYGRSPKSAVRLEDYHYGKPRHVYHRGYHYQPRYIVKKVIVKKYVRAH